VVTPETVVRWHRAGFRLYWKLISKVRRPIGRRPTPKEVRELIFRMVRENPTWGAPRVHGELLMLGFDLSERTVSRWMKRAPRDPESAKRWLTFLRNQSAFSPFEISFQYSRKPARCQRTTVSGVTTTSACFQFGQSCWRRTRFSHSRARRVRKSRVSTPNQSRNRLNMAVSYNKLPRERVSYVADSLERKHFGEAQGLLPLIS